MIALPPRRPKKRRETDLVGEVLTALQRIPGVRPLRNSNTVIEDIRGVPIRSGLGNGSPDVVIGITFGGPHSALPAYAALSPVMFAFAIELKMPGKKRSADQIAWHATAAPRGMLVTTADCVEDACSQTRAEIKRLDDWLFGF